MWYTIYMQLVTDREDILITTDTHGWPGLITYEGIGMTVPNQSLKLTLVRLGRHVLIQNNTSFAISIAFDVAVSYGSFTMASGSTYRDDRVIRRIFLLCTAAVPVGGSAANNVVVEVWD